MTDLRRAQVVEAMAQAMYENTYSAPGFPAWDVLLDHEKERFRIPARAALDAVLDVLGENIEAWEDAAWPCIDGSSFVEALRAGKGSE